MSKNIFEKSLDRYFNLNLQGNREKVLDFQQRLEYQIMQIQHLTQEHLDVKVASQPNNTLLLWAYAILSAEKNPYASYNTLIRLYDREGTIGFCIVAGCIRAFYPKAYEMIMRCLQYGRFVDWEKEIAYTPEIDKLVEHLIEDLDNPNLENTLQDYENQYPDCNMLPILHACWFWQQAQKNDFVDEDFMGHNIKKAANLLTNAFDKEIPAKYKYFVANYLKLCSCSMPTLVIMRNINSWCKEALLTFYWFTVVCVFKLFPTLDNKQSLREATVLLEQVAPGFDNLTQEIFFKPNFTVRQAFEARKSSFTYQTDTDELKQGAGCMLGIIIFAVILVIIVINALMNALK